MKAALKRFGQDSIHHAMPLDAALALERGGYDINSEVRFAMLAPAGVAGMLARLFDNRQDRGLEPFVKRPRDPVL